MRHKVFVGFIGCFVSLFIGSAQTRAEWTIDLETGIVFVGHNDVRIPRDTGTNISLTDDLKTDEAAFVRARLSHHWGNRHTLSVLLAPLTLKSAGAIPRSVVFEGVEFLRDTPLQGTYTFNSYRLTYRYRLYQNGKWSIGIGGTGKIRDAAVKIASDDQTAEKTNVGFVPLVNFRVTLAAAPRWTFALEGDALAAPQGRAEDVALTALFAVSPRIQVKAGYRVLEGGADVAEVYNFALLHYAVAGLVVRW